MNNRAISESIELITFFFVGILAISLIIAINLSVKSQEQQANLLSNAGYANTLSALLQTKNMQGQTIGELIGTKKSQVAEEINRFINTTLPGHEYAVYIEDKQKLNLIAGKPVEKNSVILHGLLPLPDGTVSMLVVQVST